MALPNVRKNVSIPVLESDASGMIFDSKIKEDDLRHVLKAIDKKCDIVRFETFYYPVYFVSLENRKMKIDGVTGKEL
jgi:hypothetical protein